MARNFLTDRSLATLKNGAAWLLVALAFFVALTPLALVLRWLGRDALGLRPPPRTDSYWIERQPGRSNHLRDQF